MIISSRRSRTDNKSHYVARNRNSSSVARNRNSSSDDNSTAMIRNSSVKSPWLMLPPSVQCGNMLYNFYNLAEPKIERLRSTLEVDDDVMIPNWWVRINLPSLLTLPDPQINCCGIVSKLILSCSPDHDLDQCRAMMIFGPLNRLAFCQPGRSTHWTPIGHLYWSKKFYWEVHDHDDGLFARQYTDCVYSTTHKLFFCFVMWKLECIPPHTNSSSVLSCGNWSVGIFRTLSAPGFVGQRLYIIWLGLLVKKRRWPSLLPLGDIRM
ncbi:Unknown protein [Striga hermonthica]|uniref:KIB1-4 beta-propeller domain-containing protein n=1 Tax=Striga hermonthica TaxID=68872 RepID=A0A9N7NTK0_STRHE|nr:Unknown protein [Striga hermonthica]